MAKDGIASAIEPGDHGTTFGVTPLATSVALAVLSIVTEKGFLEKVQEVTSYFIKQLQGLKDSFSL